MLIPGDPAYKYQTLWQFSLVIGILFIVVELSPQVGSDFIHLNLLQGRPVTEILATSIRSGTLDPIANFSFCPSTNMICNP